MGTRGLTGLKHVVLGSVAERTLRLRAVPGADAEGELTPGGRPRWPPAT